MINKFLNYLSDTLHPKRRRTASSKAWEVELEQEEHSLSLSQHSSPSQSDQEQTPLMKPTDSISVSQGFHLFKRIPSNCQSNNSLASKQKELRNMAQGTRQDVQFLGEHQNQPKLEKFLHFVPSGRQAAQYTAVEQKSLEGGPVPNLVSNQFFHDLVYASPISVFVHAIDLCFLLLRLVLRSEVKLTEPSIPVS